MIVILFQKSLKQYFLRYIVLLIMLMKNYFYFKLKLKLVPIVYLDSYDQIVTLELKLQFL